ncbi:MAG: hypothetical protein ABI690_02665 [Chloroflexota bacterium]
MKRLAFFALILSFVLVGIVLGQTDAEPTFTLIQEIGKLRPQGIEYDPNFDQLALTNLDGSLILADASTLATRHTLYQQGFYSGYKFSHDGRYLALAIDRRVEVWDTQAGTLNITLEPESVLSLTGALTFSDNDQLLLFDSVVPAPASLRRSENDTSILPWMWDLPSARRERNSTLPGGAESYPFFGFRNGLIIGPNNALIGALPGRLQVIDGRSKDLTVENELVMNRLETDPMDIWRSLRDDFLYVRPNGQNNLVQVNTADGSSLDLPLGQELGYRDLATMQGFQLSKLARIIGEPDSVSENPLLRLIFGDDYQDYQGYEATTVTLLDILEPVTVGREQMGMLVYTFHPDEGYGVMEFIRPVDIVDMALDPEGNHLMVRRASGLQPIELYDLNTGLLEHTYFPAEPDAKGGQTFAFNQDGSAILSDFQRFDTATGSDVLLEPDYTRSFEQYFFSQDSRQIITLNGSDWRVWDIATGEVIQRETLNLRGNIVDSSPDARRYLTEYTTDAGEVFEIVEVGSDQRPNITIPTLPGRSFDAIVPSDDWQNYLVVYSATPSSSHYPGNEVALYNIERGQLQFLAGDDLPPPDGRSYAWLDNTTAVISSSAPSGSQPQRIYGLDYDASGVPACLVQTYPQAWQSFIPLWEQFNHTMNADSLGRLTQRLCAALPTDPQDLTTILTPTPRANYLSESTAVPLGIAGVPTCLTRAFPREALAYAEAWRQMSAGLDDKAKADLETEVCEGLITSLYQVDATPTTDPNQFNPATATPIDSGPITVDSGFEQRLKVMLVDINTGERQIGSYIPPTKDTSRPLDLILTAFQREKKFYPSGNVQLSPDGNLLAMNDESGFIDIYRLAAPYESLIAAATSTAASGQEATPRTISLAPTTTPPFEYAGQARPTLTPTITPTAPPMAEATTTLAENGKVEDICPAETLYDVSNPPPQYVASGRIFTPADTSISNGRGMMVLNPATGTVTYDDALPICLAQGGCRLSFDQNWMLNQSDTISVMHPDGSDATALFDTVESPDWPQQFDWLGLNTLEYRYSGFLPDKYRGPVTLARHFDPISGVETEPFVPPAAPTVNNLPTNALALQPLVEQYWLVSTDSGDGSSQKYYIYDRQTGTATYFARMSGGLNYQWHPLGESLYYQYPNDRRWFRFNTATGQHEVMGALPDGLWSRDGRYRVRWGASLSDAEYRDHIEQKELLPKISIWDSQTGLTRRYCVPETGTQNFSEPFLWSPDNRYLTFTIPLSPEGDTFPVLYTPTPQDPTPTPLPTETAIPLETQYQYQKPRTLVLDTQTGSITILTDDVNTPTIWTGEAQ